MTDSFGLKIDQNLAQISATNVWIGCAIMHTVMYRRTVVHMTIAGV